MLQISSGKFFKTSDEFLTIHRGTFYTNYLTFGDDSISTSIGELLAAKGFGGLGAFNYNIRERIEGTKANGVLISTGGAELVDDFSAVVSFTLNIVCHSNPDLVRRLTGPTEDKHRNRYHPRSYLHRVFDTRVTANANDAQIVNDFMDKLVGLKRKDYEKVIRAIRRYVTATHRIVDETDLAYSLFVMSIETLAQSTKIESVSWADYDEVKRCKIDTALKNVSDVVSDKIKEAILRSEHVAIARKFRAFVIEHLSASFFREEAVSAIRPISRPDLEVLLKRAYEIRSAYVHRLEGLPRILLPPFDLSETVQIDSVSTLTFQGMARLARHVIFGFVERAPKVEREEFNWRSALPNVISMQLASHYWIGDADKFNASKAQYWLQNLLGQILATTMDNTVPITELKPILDKIEKISIEEKNIAYRRSMIAIYEIFFRIFPNHHPRPLRESLIERFKADFEHPNVEELAVYLATGSDTPWSIEEFDALHEKYYRERNQKKSLKLGQLFETMFTLRLAELHRSGGNEPRARQLISFAMETLPGHRNLVELENSILDNPLPPINVRKILGLPG